MAHWIRCRLATVLGFALLLPGESLAQDRFFTSNGYQIRYVDEGSGEPVVLIHGYSSSIENTWMESGVFRALAQDYRVIALDARGHGKSAKPHNPEAYGVHLVDDVVRLLDHLKIERAHIVGYSMGGIITAKMLVMYPERFLSATLGGSAGRRRWTEQNQRAAEADAEDLESSVPFRRAILSSWPADQPPPAEDVIKELSRQRAAGNDLLALAALVRTRRDLLVTDSALMASPVPVLAIAGTDDPVIADVNALRAAWPALQVVEIAGATHAGEHGAVKRPEFVRALRQFLARPTSKSPRKDRAPFDESLVRDPATVHGVCPQ